jgi:hypothetical protein
LEGRNPFFCVIEAKERVRDAGRPNGRNRDLWRILHHALPGVRKYSLGPARFRLHPNFTIPPIRPATCPRRRISQRNPSAGLRSPRRRLPWVAHTSAIGQERRPLRPREANADSACKVSVGLKSMYRALPKEATSWSTAGPPNSAHAEAASDFPPPTGCVDLLLCAAGSGTAEGPSLPSPRRGFQSRTFHKPPERETTPVTAPPRQRTDGLSL